MFYIINLIVLLLIGFLIYNVNLTNHALLHEDHNIPKKENRRNDKLYLFISGLQLSLIMSLRNNTVGTDTNTYVNIYNRILQNNHLSYIQLAQLDSTFRKAPVWTIMMKWLSRIISSTQAYLIFTGFFIIILIWVAIYYSKCNCRKATLLYYLLFFTPSLNATRTYMAVAMISIGYVFLEHRKKFSGIILLFTSMFVHSTAIIGVGLIALSYIDFSKKFVRHIAILTLTLLALFYRRIIPIFIDLFPIYEDYLERVTFVASERVIVLQVVFIASLFQSKAAVRKYQINNYNMKFIQRLDMIIFAEIILAFVGISFWYVQRILFYLQIFVIFQWAIFSEYKTKYKVIYEIALYGMSLFYFGYRLYQNHGNVLPYLLYCN